jgi:TolB-like protein
MSEPTSRAVFLSYAREDAEPSRRIAEALRGFGVEVWFDMSELRGGDDWNGKIKRQIRECALFIPVISTHTQSRDEGYFRREWLLAVERKRDMAEDRAFIIPVVIDDTSESSARVPEQFLIAHVTRLPGGDPTPEFVAQVMRLLQAGGVSDAGGSRPATRSPLPTPPPAAQGRFPFLSVALGVVVITLVAFEFLRPAASPAPASSATPPNAAKAAAPVVPVVIVPDAHSIAVLPFINMSADKDQEYFSDGISEELLNLLAKIPELRVTSRSSAFYYKGKEIKLAQVAQELHVAHILEGSIRKSGQKLRITAQLIDARSDTHLWSETYDRDLTDIFAVQDEIAGAVVAQLKVKLLGTAPKAKVVNPEAYALFLQARQLRRQSTRESFEQALVLIQQALALDPNYPEAARELYAVYINQAENGLRPPAEAWRLGREALNQTLAIDPDFALAYDGLVFIAMAVDNDLAAAARYSERALALEPTNVASLANAASLLAILGRLDACIATNAWVIAREPLVAIAHGNQAQNYFNAGRFAEAAETYRTVLRLSPAFIGAQARLGEAMVFLGQPEAALVEVQKETDPLQRLSGLALVNHALGRRAEADAALGELIARHGQRAVYLIAEVQAYRNEADRAFEWLENAVVSHDSKLANIPVDILMANLKEDPRWLPFLRKIGKAPEQLAAIRFDVKLPAR